MDNHAQSKDWAPERLRAILDKAKKRQRVWREIDLSKFDPELLAPDGTPQTIRVWVNAPGGMMEFIRTVGWADENFYAALGELCDFAPEAWRDLFDTWEPAFKSWVVRQLFDASQAYSQERFDFLVSSSTDSTASNSEKLVSTPD